jgi:uncharacterized protein YjhX (UPF0386 family)
MQPDDAVLRRLYEAEQKSLADIGRIYGVHRNQVRRWLIRAQIPTRDISTGTKLAWKGQTDKQRAASALNAAVARSFLTEDSYRKISESNKGRDAPNRGKSWTSEERATHAAYRATLEYREKMAAAQRGELGHNWQGGKTDESSLHGWPWRMRRRECYERDGWTCQDCGCKCLNTSDSKKHPKRKIQAHHIVSRRDGGTDDLSNLITLCMSCHHRRERAGPKE